MDIGLAISAQGMLAEQVRQNELSNDLANGSTPGYKPQLSEQRSFDSLLLQNSTNGQAVGTIDAGVDIAKTVTSTASTPLEQTGQALDFGIQGDGFFAVRTPQGIRYTRDGQFQANAQSRLVDGQGNEVLSQNGAPIAVSAQGTVPPSSLGVFNVTGVAKQGDNYFTGASGGRGTGTVKQGELEDSSVDPVNTMVHMMTAMQTSRPARTRSRRSTRRCRKAPRRSRHSEEVRNA